MRVHRRFPRTRGVAVASQLSSCPLFAPDASTAPLRRFLARQGFAPECWGCGLNLGPTRKAIARLDAAVCEGAARYGRKVSLLGISLGGTLAREAAKRCPGLVARVITVASPVNLPVATPLAPLALLAAALWDRNAWHAFLQVSEAPPVPLTAIVSPVDGVVDWRACVPRPAPHVETVLIASAHMTISSHSEVLRVIAARLAGG